jgi:hypothetical protein
MRMYSNLLIERRKHYCGEVGETKSYLDEFSIDEELENGKKDEDDLVEVYVDNNYEIVESYVRLKTLKMFGEDNLQSKNDYCLLI